MINPNSGKGIGQMTLIISSIAISVFLALFIANLLKRSFLKKALLLVEHFKRRVCDECYIPVDSVLESGPYLTSKLNLASKLKQDSDSGTNLDSNSDMPLDLESDSNSEIDLDVKLEQDTDSGSKPGSGLGSNSCLDLDAKLEQDTDSGSKSGLDLNLDSGFGFDANLGVNFGLGSLLGLEINKNLEPLKQELVKLFEIIIQKQRQSVKSERDSAIYKQARRVAHDIQSPLNALMLMMEKATFENENQKYIVNIALKRVSEISQSLLYESLGEPYIDDLINSQRIPTEDLPLTMKLTRLDETQLLDLVKELIKEKQAEYSKNKTVKLGLKIKNLESLVLVLDKVLLQRALSNLINNAIEALDQKRGGSVVLSLEISNGQVCFAVIDNGRGIPECQLKSIFIEGKSNKKQGHGLGLSVVNQMASNMDGQIEVYSKENQGTKIELIFPTFANGQPPTHTS